MHLAKGSSRIGVATLLGLFVAIGSLEAIRNYDYFWHLATGRWIVEHGALPSSDPFTLASHDLTWINLEWLFQSVLFPCWKVLGHVGLTVVLAVAIGFGAALLFLHARTRSATGAALLLVSIAWIGAAHRLDVRPETAAIPFLVSYMILLLRRPARWELLTSFVLTVVWFAVHPSALLAPVMAGIVLLGSLIDQREAKQEHLRRLAQTLLTGLALLINPWGLAGVLAPVHLATTLQSEGLVNLEWLPSSPRVFPELYVVVVFAILVILFRNHGALRWARLLLLLFIGFLAVRYVRNHAFFYPALPVLLAPSIGSLSPRWNRSLVIISAAVLAFGFARQDPGLGVAIDQFPVRSVERLQAAGLRGNVYNPDQFGGYLVWSFYPERRALVDGRNELHVDFFRRFEDARLDERRWKGMFAEFDLTLAVEEYRVSDVEVIDGVTGERRTAPASTVYYPRQTWALIGFDQASMLFARRDGHPKEIIRKLELRSIVPDARAPEDVALGAPEWALQDLRMLEAAAGSFPRLERLREMLEIRTGARQLTMPSRSNDSASSTGHRS